MEVAKLVGITKPRLSEISEDLSAEDLIAYCARVSNPKNQNNFETAAKLLSYCIKHKHWSPFEMVNVLIEINTSRTIARQLLRHRSFAFQEFCVDGDTLITTLTKSGRSKKIKIKDLYKRYMNSQYRAMSDNLIRIYDKTAKVFVSANIKEVFNTGKKEVYELVLDNNKRIVATKDHKIFTLDGFKTIEKLDISADFVGCNGVPLYQNKEWLEQAKRASLFENGGLQFIADLSNTSRHTIRRWLKKYNLQFSRDEKAKVQSSWNRGLPTEEQPRFGKFLNKESRDKIRQSHKKGKESSLYKHGNTPWRKKVTNWCKGFHTELLISQNYKCAITGETITRHNSEIDHIIPIYQRPDLAYDVSNLQVLSKIAHKNKTKLESKQARLTASFVKIKSISYVGVRETYDLEVNHEDHNYIANGIITHNSGRYSDPRQSGFLVSEARLQDEKNRQNSIETDDAELKADWIRWQNRVIDLTTEAYEWAQKNYIAKEVARDVLPEGLVKSRLYVNGTLRSWIHYAELRTGVETQKEHRQVAQACKEILMREFPFLKTHWE